MNADEAMAVVEECYVYWSEVVEAADAIREAFEITKRAREELAELEDRFAYLVKRRDECTISSGQGSLDRLIEWAGIKRALLRRIIGEEAE